VISSHEIYLELLKVIFASVVSGAISLILRRFIPKNAGFFVSIFRFGIILIVVAIIYITLTWLLRSSGFDLVKRYVWAFYMRLFGVLQKGNV
jgi:energy-converting hydrogenase Eha subunit C